MSFIFNSVASLFSSKHPQKVFLDYESIAELGKQKNRILMTIDDNVYDLTEYRDHPGGYKVLELCKGKDASEVFKKYHWPEGDSRKIMKKYKIGKLDLVRGLERKKSHE